MPLPTNFDPAYVLCVAWALVGSTLLTTFHQLGSADSVKDRVRSRTYARLLVLNTWLDGQIERQWRKLPSPEVIPDLDTLLVLKQRVDQAHAVQRRLDRRVSFIELGRLLSALHVVAAVAAAAALLYGVSRGQIQSIAKPTFTGGIIVVVALLVIVIVATMGILRGTDL